MDFPFVYSSNFYIDFQHGHFFHLIKEVTGRKMQTLCQRVFLSSQTPVYAAHTYLDLQEIDQIFQQQL